MCCECACACVRRARATNVRVSNVRVFMLAHTLGRFSKKTVISKGTKGAEEQDVYRRFDCATRCKEQEVTRRSRI